MFNYFPNVSHNKEIQLDFVCMMFGGFRWLESETEHEQNIPPYISAYIYDIVCEYMCLIHM